MHPYIVYAWDSYTRQWSYFGTVETWDEAYSKNKRLGCRIMDRQGRIILEGVEPQ